MVEHDVADQHADLGAAGLAGAHHVGAVGDEPLLEQRGLRRLAGAVPALEREEQTPAGHFFAGALRVVVRRAGVRLGAGPLARLSAISCDGALERDLHGVFAARDRRVRLAVGDVRAEPAVLELDRLAADRIRLELLQRAARAARAVLRLGVDGERLVEGDVEQLLLARERAGVGPLLEVRDRSGRSAP